MTDTLVILENKNIEVVWFVRGITITVFLVTAVLVKMHVTQHKNIGNMCVQGSGPIFWYYFST